jgi:hypothetical protein
MRRVARLTSLIVVVGAANAAPRPSGGFAA